jgi:hypothetical protein
MIHSTSVIFDNKLSLASHGVCAEINTTVGPHRILSIQNEVEHHLLKLIGIGFH